MYKQILCAIDDSESAKQGLEEAIRLTKNFNAVLRILHVVDNALLFGSGAVVGDFFEDIRSSGYKILTEAKKSAHYKGIEAETILDEITGGRVAEAIIAQAKSWPADLIVLGTHGRRGVSHLLLGSDAETVVRLSPIPVLTLKAN